MNIITYIIALTVIIIVEKLTNVSPQKYHEARLTYYYTINYANYRIAPSGSPLDVAGLCRKSLHPP